MAIDFTGIKVEDARKRLDLGNAAFTDPLERLGLDSTRPEYYDASEITAQGDSLTQGLSGKRVTDKQELLDKVQPLVDSALEHEKTKIGDLMNNIDGAIADIGLPTSLDKLGSCAPLSATPTESELDGIKQLFQKNLEQTGVSIGALTDVEASQYVQKISDLVDATKVELGFSQPPASAASPVTPVATPVTPSAVPTPPAVATPVTPPTAVPTPPAVATPITPPPAAVAPATVAAPVTPPPAPPLIPAVAPPVTPPPVITPSAAAAPVTPPPVVAPLTVAAPVTPPTPPLIPVIGAPAAPITTPPAVAPVTPPPAVPTPPAVAPVTPPAPPLIPVIGVPAAPITPPPAVAPVTPPPAVPTPTAVAPVTPPAPPLIPGLGTPPAVAVGTAAPIASPFASPSPLPPAGGVAFRSGMSPMPFRQALKESVVPSIAVLGLSFVGSLPIFGFGGQAPVSLTVAAIYFAGSVINKTSGGKLTDLYVNTKQTLGNLRRKIFRI